MKQPITVLIACRDVPDRLSWCIESCIDFADEILLAQVSHNASMSKFAQFDEKVRVIGHEPVRRDDFMNWSISRASHQWILLLDCDERLNIDLTDEIELVLSRGATSDAYSIDRNTFVNGRQLEAIPSKTARCIRLFQRDQVTLSQADCKNSIEVESGLVGKLSSKLSRYPDWRFETALNQLTLEAAERAEVLRLQGKKTSCTKLLLSPAFAFMVQYFWQGSLFDGIAGIRVAWQNAFKTFCTHAYLLDSNASKNIIDESEVASNGVADLLDPTFRRAA